MRLKHNAILRNEEEVLKALPEGFQVIVVLSKESVQVYGNPQKTHVPYDEHLADCLFAGANVLYNNQARRLRK